MSGAAELLALSSPDAVHAFVAAHPGGCIVTFSAHWCGPCKASHPALQALAESQSATVMGIAYESDLGDALHTKFRVRAFPTHVLFVQQTERARVEGANVERVRNELVSQIRSSIAPTMPVTGGATLGGGSGMAARSPADARAARLAKLGATPAPTATVVVPAAPVAMETEVEETKPTDADGDVTMDQDSSTPAAAAESEEDPCAKLDPEVLNTLTESMGFPLLRAQKGMLYGNMATVEGAVEWLMAHQDDADIDEPIVATKAQSYKCNECGRILSNMANLELHANKTGHSDFEESTERIQPMTEEEKAAKIAEIKELLKLKRAEREEAEKVDETEREKQRRTMGKEMAKTKEQLDQEQRKREAYLRKKEKDAFQKERLRLREELARDRAERAAHKGKLSSRLGVDGYKPDGIQYDVPAGAGDDGADDAAAAAQPQSKPNKPKADVGKIGEYISKVSSYKAGGDGGVCLKVLKTYISNVVDKPEEEKFKTINMENKAFKTKVKPFVGAKSVLLACGFHPNESGDALVLSDDADPQVLKDTKAKLEAALIAYG